MRKARLTITPEQEQICTILSTESQFADEIAIRLNWSIIRVMSELSILEIQGIVEKDIDGRYIQSLA
jgi:predicted Rossmann fold nucleotide-binding protein DprA/Smf involved in DNA uptake